MCALACRDILAWLVPRLLGAKPEGDTADARKAAAQDEGLSGIAKEHVQGLLQDRTSSHLLEVSKSWPLARHALRSGPCSRINLVSIVRMCFLDNV